ncbi:polyketide synthase [Streptomyces oceani]|uniref:Polyketide synthase n=1 Tax=Streptomyces oceani TaxID=1075402 RepID=A0A1E7KET0_9ACTN|nr:polyketide synthase [Streptomyces oceani]OEV02431.1 polyketide synthase [Streptomyces oceani]
MRDAVTSDEETPENQPPPTPQGPPEPIAIVGVAALYPGAHTVGDYWRLLTDEARLPPTDQPPSTRGLDDLEVDLASFGIPPAQARSIARMQLLMLEGARRCLADAGHPERPLPTDRTDVVVGTCFGLDRQYANALRIEGARYARHLAEVAAAHEFGGCSEADAAEAAHEFRAELRRRLGASPHDRVGEMASTIPARIATACKLRGRTLALESQDATSYLGVAHAIDSLRGRLSDAVLVLAGQQEEGPFLGHALAGKGLSAAETRPFDPDGTGFSLGAGVGGLLLKRLSTAVRDGDRIYATVLDGSLGHDARPGVFRYSTSAARRHEVAAEAYARSGVAASSVRYVECAGHGVGPDARAELEALSTLFTDPDSAAEQSPPVVLGSARDRLGHTFANAGLASVSKVALALHHRTLPPHRDTGGGPRTALSGTPFRLARHVEPWPDPEDGAPRRAAVSGSSLTGTLCHLVLQEHAPTLGSTVRSGAAVRTVAGRTASREPIAIVGYGGSFADSTDADGFWTAMLSGRDRIGPLPEVILDRRLYHSPGQLSPDRSYTDLGAPVRVPTRPPEGLRVTPRRYAAMDPAQRLGLMVAEEMFTRRGTAAGPLTGPGVVAVGSNLGLTRERRLNAGLCRDTLEATVRETAVFAKLSAGGMDPDALLKLVRERFGDPESADSPSALDGALASGVPALIANEHRLAAVPVAVEAACASTLAAIDLAVSRLRSGSVRYAIAGGVELPCNARDMALCSALGLLSHDRITPFDTEADGFTPGDGCSLFLLKRYADARRDGEPIYGLLRGVGASNDAKSLIAPDASGQARAMRRSFEQVDFGPAAVDYLEAHGTGTRVGDRVEIDATSQVYADHERDRPLEIGSAKSFVGHTFAAAGGAGLLRALLALRTGTIPPNANLRTVNPQLHLAGIPARISTEGREWERADGRPRRAAVSSFGTGGINYHLLVEEPMDGAR